MCRYGFIYNVGGYSVIVKRFTQELDVQADYQWIDDEAKLSNSESLLWLEKISGRRV